MQEGSPFKNWRVLDARAHVDARGSLVALTEGEEIPFPIRRVYFIVETDGAPRGFHAHLKLEQVMFCLNGSCLIVLDDGTQREEVVLNSPTRGLYIGPMAWHEMADFTAGSVFLVLASAPFDEADYIRDYNAFILTIATERTG